MPNTERRVHLGFLFYDVARLIRKAFDQRMEPLGITRSQWRVIAQLSRRDDVTQTELAETLDLGKVALGGILDRLEDKGWIERHPDAEDRRAKRVCMTPKVGEFLGVMTETSDDMLQHVFDGLASDEEANIENYLLTIRKNLIDLNQSIPPKEKTVAE